MNIVSIRAIITLNTYLVKAIPNAVAKDNSPAITQTKVYKKVSRAWEEIVETLFLSQRYLPSVITFNLWNIQTSNLWLTKYAIKDPITNNINFLFKNIDISSYGLLKKEP